jgi:hypothetical protein
MIIHTVICRVKRPADTDAATAFAEAAEAFGTQPPHALGPAVVARDLGLRPEGRSVSEVLLEVRFADEAAFHAYLADPAHVAFVENTMTPSLEGWLSLQRAG